MRRRPGTRDVVAPDRTARAATALGDTRPPAAPRALRRRVVGLALGIALTAACTPAPDDASPSPTLSASPTPEARAAELRRPDLPATVLDGDAVARAVAASQELFAGAPLAVLAPADDVAAQLRAAGVAVALGAPLLLTGPAPSPTDAELERLDVDAVVTVGAAAAPSGLDALVAALEDDPALVEAAARTGSPAPGTEVAVVAGLAAPGEPTTPSGTPSPTPATGTDGRTRVATADALAGRASADGPSTGASGSPRPTSGASPAAAPPALPATAAADPVGGVAVLATGDPAELAPAATARAAGHPVVVVPGADPRARGVVQPVAAAVEAASTAADDGAPAALLALGPELGPADRFAWTASAAATGVELPGGGQLAFAGSRMVALYGTPVFAGLGMLGEQDAAGAVARVQGLAAEYQALTTDVVVPAFELIVTVASAEAGPDGNYSNELPVETFVPWVEAAAAAGIYVIIDLQPGRTDFLTQAQAYEPLLRHPHVGLALDPEWRLAPDQVHLRQIGSVGVDEVNAVAAWLATYTRERSLPQKVLVVHQFAGRMVSGRERLDTSHPELAVVLHVDGQGSQPAKAGTWAALRAGAPEGLRWGWKNFVDEDVPMLTPPQTYQVQPVPDLVTYQ